MGFWGFGVLGYKKAIEKLEKAATEHYAKTHEHLGVFKTSEAADDFANKTHSYMPDGTDRQVYLPPVVSNKSNGGE